MTMQALQTFIGEGDLYAAVVDPNTRQPGPLVDLGNATEFAFDFKNKEYTMPSRRRNGAGSMIDSFHVRESISLKIKLTQLRKESLGWVFQAQMQDTTQTKGQATDEQITLLNHLPFQLPKHHIQPDGFSIAKVSGGSSAYTMGSDYRVNTLIGRVEIVPGSQLASDITSAGSSGLAVHVSYKWGDTSGTRIRFGTAPAPRLYLLFKGQNMRNGEQWNVQVWECQINPATKFDFLKEGWNEIELEGTLLKPDGRDEPAVLELVQAA